MTTLTVSTKLEIAGCIGSILAFAVLFVGLGAIGGGHGSPVIWLLGLIAAPLSGAVLLAGVIRSALKPLERGALIPGISFLIVFGVLWMNFFTVAEWLSRLVY